MGKIGGLWQSAVLTGLLCAQIGGCVPAFGASVEDGVGVSGNRFTLNPLPRFGKCRPQAGRHQRAARLNFGPEPLQHSRRAFFKRRRELRLISQKSRYFWDADANVSRETFLVRFVCGSVNVWISRQAR